MRLTDKQVASHGSAVSFQERHGKVSIKGNKVIEYNESFELLWLYPLTLGLSCRGRPRMGTTSDTQYTATDNNSYNESNNNN